MDNAQVLRCKCGKIFAACVEPYCYTDKYWLKELKDHVNAGGEVGFIGIANFKFEKCTCETSLSILEANPKQLQIFSKK